MSEIEFDQLLDAVRAVVSNDRDTAYLDLPDFLGFPRPANDNGEAWPMIPFPAGWNAVC
jgi:hypothetical protein